MPAKTKVEKSKVLTKPAKSTIELADHNRDERLTFRCPLVLRQAIEHHARKANRSVSDWIVLTLNRAVNQADEDQNSRDGY